MQLHISIGTQTDNVASIRWYFRFIENTMEHIITQVATDMLGFGNPAYQQSHSLNEIVIIK
ncbi:hypothetical protein THIOM_001480 [Candidatus Thiomargarita nelsonii]|uniref:Uncharacterized protein n=1 Tax=Candidatus Thiomargarita nelsonii TaxID=1003181 RepID=A0A176S474_9GAMM|nr:hypothetical protein THIOM_001480 [Candidatus Thiomargarita nelsonii]